MDRKILAPIDGSEQSINAVRYISRIFPVYNTKIELLHIREELPESFLDLSIDPALTPGISSISAWSNQMTSKINEFMTEAKKILTDAGFAPELVNIKIQSKEVGIARDILKESKTGYSLVVVGRTGTSKIKDVAMGSITTKLIGRTPHIPVVTVGGNPDSKKILIGFDGSDSAMKAIDYIVKLLGNTDCEITLIHVIRPLINPDSKINYFIPAEEAEWIAIKSKMIEPALVQAENCLKNGGFSHGQISKVIITTKTSRAAAIAEKTHEEGYGTVVVGRRGISMVEEFIMGRVSTKVLNMVTEAAVWVV
jgi:nucleotide-binding universal stress UspA family protein